ncbi:MAG: hypothetical protein ACR2M0_03120 [Chloroflexia bacterium]
MAYEWLRLGVQAALEDNREDARYYFVQAVRNDLNYARGWLYLGGVAEDPALTLSCMQKVLQLDPEEAQARAGLLWARNKLGLIQPMPALEAPQAPMELWPTPAVAPAPTHIPELRGTHTDEAAPGEEDDNSTRLMKRGIGAAADDDRARARYYFLKAIAADAGNTRAWLYFGGVADDPYTTLSCMERVLRAEPGNREARAGADWAVRKLGVTAPAMRWWK